MPKKKSASISLKKSAKFIKASLPSEKPSPGHALDYSASFRHMLVDNPNPIFIQINSRFAYLNPSALKLFGARKAEDLLGRPTLDFVHPRYHDLIRRRMSQAREGKHVSLSLEQVFLRLDKSEVEVETAAFPMKFGKELGGIVFAVDISARKKAEELAAESVESLKRMRYAVDHASDIVYWVTEDSRLEYANDAATRLLGYNREELERMRLWEIDFDFKKEEWPVLWNTLKTKKTSLRLAHHKARDGRVIPMEVMGNFEVFEGKEYCVAFCRDISQRLKNEEDRHRLEAQVQHSQKLESLGVLAGGIAHDFNNLLLVILGNLELARQGQEPSCVSGSNLAAAEEAAHRAAEVCRQMLAYSGKGRFEIKPVEWGEVVTSLEHILQVSISKKVVLRYNLAPNLPKVMADATQLRQVIMNLVINASEAVGEKSGVVSVSTGAMQCDEAYLECTYTNDRLAPGSYAFVEVSDTGSGMDADTKAKIFDPFFTTKFTGRGLGLAAVLGIVRGHKGAIKVYSEPGKGTSFKVLLPVTSEKSAVAAPASSPKSWKGKGIVLLVDDEETVLAVGSQMLKTLGFKVLSAADGKAALEIFRDHCDEIACVILDLTMPHMDGEETFREMRRLQAGVRVILSSGYNEQDVIQRFAGKGLTGFLQKPYLTDVLGEKLKQVLQK